MHEEVPQKPSFQPPVQLERLRSRERRLRLVLAGLALLAGGVITLFGWMIAVDIYRGLTAGWSALVPVRKRYSVFPTMFPAHFVLFYHIIWMLFVFWILVMGWRSVQEELQEVRAQVGFEETMRRIRAGEDIAKFLRTCADKVGPKAGGSVMRLSTRCERRVNVVFSLLSSIGDVRMWGTSRAGRQGILTWWAVHHCSRWLGKEAW